MNQHKKTTLNFLKGIEWNIYQEEMPWNRPWSPAAIRINIRKIFALSLRDSHYKIQYTNIDMEWEHACHFVEICITKFIIALRDVRFCLLVSHGLCGIDSICLFSGFTLSLYLHYMRNHFLTADPSWNSGRTQKPESLLRYIHTMPQSTYL